MGSLDLSRYGIGEIQTSERTLEQLDSMCRNGDAYACRLAASRRAGSVPIAVPEGDTASRARERDAQAEADRQALARRLESVSQDRLAQAVRSGSDVSWVSASAQPQAPRAAAPGFFDTLFDAFTGGGSRGGSRPQGAAPRPGAPQRTAVSKPSGGSGDSAADMVGALTPITTTVTDALMRIEAGRAARRRTALAPAPAGGTWSTGAKVAAGVGGVLALGVLGKLIFGRKVST